AGAAKTGGLRRLRPGLLVPPPVMEALELGQIQKVVVGPGPGRIVLRELPAAVAPGVAVVAEGAVVRCAVPHGLLLIGALGFAAAGVGVVWSGEAGDEAAGGGGPQCLQDHEVVLLCPAPCAFVATR